MSLSHLTLFVISSSALSFYHYRKSIMPLGANLPTVLTALPSSRRVTVWMLQPLEFVEWSFIVSKNFSDPLYFPDVFVSWGSWGPRAWKKDFLSSQAKADYFLGVSLSQNHGFALLCGLFTVYGGTGRGHLTGATHTGQTGIRKHKSSLL